MLTDGSIRPADEPRQLAEGVDAQLGDRIADVGFHRMQGKVQLGGDVAVGHALRDQVDHFELGVGETVPARFRTAMTVDIIAAPVSAANRVRKGVATLPVRPWLYTHCRSPHPCGGDAVSTHNPIVSRRVHHVIGFALKGLASRSSARGANTRQGFTTRVDGSTNKRYQSPRDTNTGWASGSFLRRSRSPKSLGGENVIGSHQSNNTPNHGCVNNDERRR